MRKLSDSFMEALSSGFISGIRRIVIDDKDLDFQIRNNYINIYYKGNSLLKLTEVSPKKYKVDIHPKFIGPVPGVWGAAAGGEAGDGEDWGGC